MDRYTISELASRLSAQRRQHSSRCRVCQTPITGIATRRYCSNRCRQRAKTARAAAAIPRPVTTA